MNGFFPLNFLPAPRSVQKDVKNTLQKCEQLFRGVDFFAFKIEVLVPPLGMGARGSDIIVAISSCMF